MDIRTKYNLNDEVFFIPTNQMPVTILKSKIDAIRIIKDYFRTEKERDYIIQYQIEGNSSLIPENEIALTRENALKVFDKKLKINS